MKSYRDRSHFLRGDGVAGQPIGSHPLAALVQQQAHGYPARIGNAVREHHNIYDNFGEFM